MKSTKNYLLLLLVMFTSHGIYAQESITYVISQDTESKLFYSLVGFLLLIIIVGMLFGAFIVDVYKSKAKYKIAKTIAITLAVLIPIGIVFYTSNEIIDTVMPILKSNFKNV
ncbi:hypothetical protein HX049_17130 [Myroides odoratimimus]|uniref:hypothetical protein n=1 Tax=Myroides odoratimimus TaxID=76832 RepID=UPI002577DE35|nr:hypothetical protein [Myroides odoratimimus]MDM1398868.1 hypothetical protein [Myroides odoratimimus]